MTDTPTPAPTPDLAELRRLAEAASSGPWFNDLDAEDGRPEGLITDGRGYCVACVQPHGNIKTVARTGEQFSHDDARYIAAVHPQAVLALLDRLAAAEAERDELRRLLGLLYRRYENGPTCFETDEGQIIEGQSIGNAVELSSDEDAAILAALEEASSHERA